MNPAKVTAFINHYFLNIESTKVSNMCRWAKNALPQGIY